VALAGLDSDLVVLVPSDTERVDLPSLEASLVAFGAGEAALVRFGGITLLFYFLRRRMK